MQTKTKNPDADKRMGGIGFFKDLPFTAPIIFHVTHNEIHEQIKSKLKDLELNIPVLYGGSVNPSNSKGILESEFVDGVLVGGASTKIDQLEGILNSI